MVSGRRPDLERRREVARLHRAGLTQQQIADRLGVTRQAVHQLLRQKSRAQPRDVHCASCGRALDPTGALPQDAGRAYCLACLNRTAGVPFAQRLKSFRLARRLTRAELGRRANLSGSKISDYEDGGTVPTPPTVAKLARALRISQKQLGAAQLPRKGHGRPRN